MITTVHAPSRVENRAGELGHRKAVADVQRRRPCGAFDDHMADVQSAAFGRNGYMHLAGLREPSEPAQTCGLEPGDDGAGSGEAQRGAAWMS